MSCSIRDMLDDVYSGRKIGPLLVLFTLILVIYVPLFLFVFIPPTFITTDPPLECSCSIIDGNSDAYKHGVSVHYKLPLIPNMTTSTNPGVHLDWEKDLPHPRYYNPYNCSNDLLGRLRYDLFHYVPPYFDKPGGLDSRLIRLDRTLTLRYSPQLQKELQWWPLVGLLHWKVTSVRMQLALKRSDSHSISDVKNSTANVTSGNYDIIYITSLKASNHNNQTSEVTSQFINSSLPIDLRSISNREATWLTESTKLMTYLSNGDNQQFVADTLCERTKGMAKYSCDFSSTKPCRQLQMDVTQWFLLFMVSGFTSFGTIMALCVVVPILYFIGEFGVTRSIACVRSCGRCCHGRLVYHRLCRSPPSNQNNNEEGYGTIEDNGGPNICDSL